MIDAAQADLAMRRDAQHPGARGVGSCVVVCLHPAVGGLLLMLHMLPALMLLSHQHVLLPLLCALCCQVRRVEGKHMQAATSSLEDD